MMICICDHMDKSEILGKIALAIVQIALGFTCNFPIAVLYFSPNCTVYV